jgi:hypothetical protein
MVDAGSAERACRDKTMQNRRQKPAEGGGTLPASCTLLLKVFGHVGRTEATSEESDQPLKRIVGEIANHP